MQETMVSIVCNTYNHEKYIESALKGFVSQKTTFPFEILVYDDASTDNTAQIIREYHSRYPKLIKPILMIENQYSQGKRPGEQNRSRAIGKYIAMCEGDDYWIDEYKLQKQFDYMEQNTDCTFCFTNGYVCVDGVVKRQVVPWNIEYQKSYNKHKSNLSHLELIDLGFIPTASYFIRTSAFKNKVSVSQRCFQGDLYLALSTTMQGYAHFIDEPTCVYRFGVENSATTRWKQYGNEKQIALMDKFLNLFSELCKHDTEDNNAQWEFYACFYRIQKAYCQRDFKTLHSRLCRHYAKSRGFMFYYKYLLQGYCPGGFRVCF